MLSEKEGEQHQHASIMHNPPHINVTLGEALSVGREGRDVLRDKQSQVSRCGFSDQLCRETAKDSYYFLSVTVNVGCGLIFKVILFLNPDVAYCLQLTLISNDLLQISFS